jgi:hypothetical protein
MGLKVQQLARMSFLVAQAIEGLGLGRQRRLKLRDCWIAKVELKSSPAGGHNYLDLVRLDIPIINEPAITVPALTRKSTFGSRKPCRPTRNAPAEGITIFLQYLRGLRRTLRGTEKLKFRLLSSFETRNRISVRARPSTLFRCRSTVI